MAYGEVLIKFDSVSFEYGPNKPILNEASFSVRRGTKITCMGQNGAGKSTIFQLITGAIQPDSGRIIVGDHVSVAIAQQVIPREQMAFTVREFFEKCLENKTSKKIYDIDPRIDEVLAVVNLSAPHNKIIKSFSGGQQARLLLAGALIQDSDVLLLDEPTNNLDRDGISHLTQFLINYKKTLIVISHDADFLNSFSDGVLYLDVFTHKVEQYMGNYLDAVAKISVRIESENMKNARLAKKIEAKKYQANVFARKGGGMRLVAKKMREKAEELDEEIVDVRREDKTIRPFIIPATLDFVGPALNIGSFTIIKNHKQIIKKANISLGKKERLLLTGPNGIGKSTLLESLVSGKKEGAKIAEGVRVGYYRQDFTNLNVDDTVFQSLNRAMQVGGAELGEEHMRSVAAGFLITGELIKSKIGRLSEGQKGLVSFARLALERPGLLILDEPTNHINFRHLPIIASALDKYEGAMVLVSHVPEFVKQIRIDNVLDLNG